MKLLTYLQTYHHYSRRQCIKWIQQSDIVYDNQIVQSFTGQIEQGKSLTILGVLNISKLSRIKQTSHIIPRYKPKGYVVSKSDPHNATIYELLDQQYHDRYYIGRLDKDSHGLMLLTNDPTLVDQYEHPSHGHIKIYRVQIDHAIYEQTLYQLCQTNQVRGGNGIGYDMLSCDQVEYHYIGMQHILIITLHEGKKRHLRRLLAYMNIGIIDLCRIQCGSYKLSDLKPNLFT